MRYISNYSEFEQTNEGLKTWLSTFLLMANLGLVPLNVKSADAQTKKNFVESQPQDKIDAAKFITFLNKYGFTKSLDQVWTEFTQSDPSVSTSFDDVQKYINQDGKVYRMGQKYKAQDFTGADMNKFRHCDMVLCGDIHKRQVFMVDETKPVIMVGSFIQQNFGETVSQHGFNIVKINNDKLLSYEFHDIENPVKYLTFKITDISDIEDNNELLVNA